MIQIDKNTPIAALTVGQLYELPLIKELLTITRETQQPINNNNKEFVYGLRGIRNLFNVSHVTAQRYKDTFLAASISQVGRKIIVDKSMALKLFAEREA